MKRLQSFILIALMVATAFAGVNFGTGISSANVPASNSNTATITYNSASYYINAGNTNSGSHTLKATKTTSGNPNINFGNYQFNYTTPAVTSYTTTLGTYTFTGQTKLNFSNFMIGEPDVANIKGVTFSITINGSNTVTDLPNWSNLYATDSFVWFANWTGNALVGSYSVTFTANFGSIYFSIIASTDASATLGLHSQSTTGQGDQGTIYQSGWDFSGVTWSPTWTNPSNTAGLEFNWISDNSAVTSTITNNSEYTSSFPTTVTFGVSGVQTVQDITVSYYINNTVESETTTYTQATNSETITQNGNWFNTSSPYTFSVTSPTNSLNGALVDGKNWNTVITYTVSGLYDSGYGAPFNDFEINKVGVSSPSQTNSYSGTLTNSFSVSLNTENAVNYKPTINTPSVTFVSGSTAKVVFTTSEQITGELENVVISWGDGTQTTLNSQAFGTFTETHQYANIGTFTVTASVTNIPSDSTITAYSSSSQASYTMSFGESLNPGSGATIISGDSGSISWNPVNLGTPTVTLQVNQLSVNPTISSSTATYKDSSAGSIALTYSWTLTSGGITSTYSAIYAPEQYPTQYAPYVNVAYSHNNINIGTQNNVHSSTTYKTVTNNTTISGNFINSYVRVNITNTQSSATPNSYNQLVFINSSIYKNNETGNLSNVIFFNSSSTSIIPSWIENNNTNTSTNTSYWLKIPFSIPADTTTYIYMGFVNKTINLFSPTGNEGEYPTATSTYGQYDNGAVVFPAYWNFSGSSLPAGLASYTYTGTVSVSNHLYLEAGTNYQIAGVASTSSYPDSYIWFSDGYSFTTTAGGPSFVQTMVANDNTWQRVDTGTGFSGGLQNSIQASTGSSYPTTGTAWYTTGTTHGSFGDSYTSPSLIGINWQGTSINTLDSSSNSLSSLTDTSSGMTAGTNTYWGAQVRTGGNGAGYFYLQYVFGIYGLPNEVMPSVSLNQSISKHSMDVGTIFSNTTSYLANLSQFQIIGHRHYDVYNPDSTNMSANDYTYNIPNLNSSKTIAVFFNKTWDFLYAFPTNYAINQSVSDNVLYFYKVQNFSSFQVTFEEPNQIADPYASVILNIIPSTDIFSSAGFILPANLFKVYVNGNQITGQSFNGIIGDTYNIQIQDAFGVNLLGNNGLNVTPTTQTYSKNINVNISEITFTNLNSTDFVNIYAKQNNITQAVITVNPTETTLPQAFPSGNYTFTYQYFNATNGQPIKTVDANVNINGLVSQTFTGETLLQLAHQLTTTKSNITTEVNSVEIALLASNSNIKNLTIQLSTNLNLTGSNVSNLLINLANNYQFTNDLINSSKISISDKLVFINDTLSSTNFNLTQKTKFLNNLLNNTNFSLQQKIGFINSTLNQVNLNLTQDIQYTNSLINNTETSLNQKLAIVNATLNNVNFNLTQKLEFTNSLLNNTNVSLQQQFVIVKSILNNVNTNISQKIAYTNTLLNNTHIELNQTLKAINSTLDNVNLNLSQKMIYTNNLVNNSKISLEQKLTFVNSTLDALNINLTQKTIYTNSLVNNSKFNIEDKIGFVNSTLNNVNFNLTNKVVYLDSLVNSTSLNLTTKVGIVNASINNFNLTLNQKIDVVKSLIGTANININQSLVFQKNTILQSNLLYKLNLALNDYVMSGGSGVVTQSDGTTVSAYSNILDPYEYNNAISYANSTISQNITWYGNPINPTWTSPIVSDSPYITMLYNNGSSIYNGEINVSYYNASTGLTLVNYRVYSIDSSIFTIPLNKQYLEDGYIMKLQLLNETGHSITWNSEVQWNAQIVFDWTHDTYSGTYSYKPVIPDSSGNYGNYNIAQLTGAFLNTTSIEQQISVAFPQKLGTIDLGNVTVEDLTSQQYLNANSQYFVTQAGVEFNWNNIATREYQITFTLSTNVTTNQDIYLTVDQGVLSGSQGGLKTYLVDTNWTNTGSSGIFIFHITINGLGSSSTVGTVTVVVNGQTISSDKVGASGNTITVSGISVNGGKGVTIKIYYTIHTTSTKSLINDLFTPIIPGTIVSYWLIILIGSIFITYWPIDFARTLPKAEKKKRYQLIGGAYSTFALVYVLMTLLYIKGLI